MQTGLNLVSDSGHDRPVWGRYGLHCVQYFDVYSVYSAHFTLYTVYYQLFTKHCTLYTIYSHLFTTDNFRLYSCAAHWPDTRTGY